MRFNIAGKRLMQELTSVSKVINSKNALSILDNFLFEINGEFLTVTGSDSENTITATLPVVDVDSDGAVAIPAKRLLDTLKEIPDQPLTFYINPDTREIELKYQNGHITFVGHAAEEFPRRREMSEDKTTFSIPANIIKRGIEKTLFAVSTETIRPILTGILWDIKPEELVFVSSDTHKLVRYINTESHSGIETHFVVPGKPSSILSGLLQKEEGMVDIVVDATSATFSMGNHSLSCRFLNGNYPNYNRVIPENNPFVMNVDRSMLLSAVRRVSLSASQASSLIKLNLQRDEVLLSSEDIDYCTTAEERLLCEYEGNSMMVGFNSGFMKEVLTNIDAENIVLKLSDPTRPGIFEPSRQAEGENLLVLIMPLQT